MTDKPMSLSREQKEALLALVSDRPKYSQWTERQKLYARFRARKILDEKAARAASHEAQGQIDVD